MTRMIVVIGKGDSADFQVIIWRDGNFHYDREVLIPAAEFHLVREEKHLLAGSCCPTRLQGWRPDSIIAGITLLLDINPGTPPV